MDIKVNKAKNNTYKVEVTIPSQKVDEAFSDALKHEAESADIKGFRKGKAPTEVVKQNVDAQKLRSHALNHFLVDVYSIVIKEHKLQPIVQPKFDVKAFEEGKDAEVEIIIIERPEIKVGDYKSALKKKGNQKGPKVKDDGTIEPNAGSSGVTNQDIIDAILETSEVGVAEELIEDETNRMMSSLIDQTARMGLTVDQYLASQGKTADQIRGDYKKVAEQSIKSDFAITQIAQDENITAEDDEVEKAIEAIPDEKSRQALSQPDQKMYVKAVLLKNKTIQKLASYAQSEKSNDSKNKGAKKDEQTSK